MSLPVYLDYHATTPTDPVVLEAMIPFFTGMFGNPASLNKSGRQVYKIVEDCRAVIATTIGGAPTEIVFTAGATEAINLALKGFFSVTKKTHLITLRTEHSAVLQTSRYLEKQGITVTLLDVSGNGLVNMDELENAITPQTGMICIMHVNNEIGVVQPIEQIGDLCKQRGICFFTDAAQSFGKIPIDTRASNIGMMALSGHKIYGPKGIGALFVSNRYRGMIAPLFHGGGQEGGLRSGTLNVPGIVGFAEAARLCCTCMNEEQDRIGKLRDLLLERLSIDIPGAIINGDLKKRIAGNLNICFPGVPGEILLNQLEDVIVSRGSACNSSRNQGSHVLRALGLDDDLAESSLRIGIGRYNTEEDILFAAERISSAVREIRSITTIV